MPESPRDDAGYCRPNIVSPGYESLDDLPVSATARTQHKAKVDAELALAQTRAATQGASGSITKGKK